MTCRGRDNGANLIRQEAHLVAVACSAAPEGHTRWTLRLLADQAVK